MMRKYEGCFLLRADLSEEGLKSEINFVEQTMTAAGAQIVKQEMWGRKNLAFPIKKKTEAVYYLFYFQAEPGLLAKIEPNFRVRENILRYLFLLRKQLPRDGGGQ
ncbi:MAG TPA: 30S ribosomal protein S6 [bacterium]|nr:30S ribosomal protein S6 [bacterium]HOL66774.1 30S ribosomal protein S6 [bacterium]HPP11512.1 30S ribosomal protein S6 [bacterium]